MKRKYLSTMTTRPYLYNESKFVAECLVNGMAEDVIKEKVVNDNVFKLASRDRRERFYSEIIKRLDLLDSELLHHFVYQDKQTSKLILLLALLKRDRLFYEWMREVVWDKYLIMEQSINYNDILGFMERKKEQDDTISKWKDTTIKTLISTYQQTLVEAEVASHGDGVLLLHQPLISISVRNYLIENEEKQVVEVLLGEVL